MCFSQKNATSKRQFKPKQEEYSKSHIYACFQHPQTLDILQYLSRPTPNKLFFDSAIKIRQNQSFQNQNNNATTKRAKEFRFERIYTRQEKFKYGFSEEINYLVERLFQGYSQSAFIYGTEQKKKDNLLIGQSQNPAFLLITLAEIFQYCHDKQIQDQVTIKLSCSIYKDGKFTDPYNLNNCIPKKKEKNQHDKKFSCIQDQQFQNLLCDDLIQGKYLLGCPQIIIRNMRTALKVLNLITKKIQDRREIEEQNTENIIFTVKLEIDKGFDPQNTGEVYQYSIPKLYIVKLGNPSINTTLNGVNKDNLWFINMFNFLQSHILQDKSYSNKKQVGNRINQEFLHVLPQQLTQILKQNPGSYSEIEKHKFTQEQKDQFSQYLKIVVMKGVADIYCFTSITNKMTSNECLTALIFSNYISAYVTKPTKTTFNISNIKTQKINYEQELINLIRLKQSQNQRENSIIQNWIIKQSLNKRNPQFQTRIHNNNKQKTAKQRSKKKHNLHKQSQNFTNTQKLKLLQDSQLSLLTHRSNTKQTINELQLNQLLLADREQNRQKEDFDENLTTNFLQYLFHAKDFMNYQNLVEYEYAQVLSKGCEKLGKFIFNEEIQEFFYSKRVLFQNSLDLRLSLNNLKQQKLKQKQIEEIILNRINIEIKKTNFYFETLNSMNGKQELEELLRIKKGQLINLRKEREIIQKLFIYYKTMSFHFIYEDNLKFIEELKRSKKSSQKDSKKLLANNQQHFRFRMKISNSKVEQKRIFTITDQISNKQESFNQGTKSVIQILNNKQNKNHPIGNLNSAKKHSNINTAYLNLNSAKKHSNINTAHLNLNSAKKHSNLFEPPNKQLTKKQFQSLESNYLQKNKYRTQKGSAPKNQDQLHMFTNSNLGLPKSNL